MALNHRQSNAAKIDKIFGTLPDNQAISKSLSKNWASVSGAWHQGLLRLWRLPQWGLTTKKLMMGLVHGNK
jgi:hypothetical protein